MTEYRPPSCPPIQRAAANQQPLLIVYKHNTVRPAAFKSPCSIVLTTADQTTPRPPPFFLRRWTPWRAESRCAGACSARWTRSSCAGTWSRGWRRSPSRTAAAGTSTSRPTRRCRAGSSGRRCPQTAPLRSTGSPQRGRTPCAVTGWATARRARTPTRRTAPASPTRASVPPRRRPSGGRGRTPDRQPSPGAGTHELQVRRDRSEGGLTLWPNLCLNPDDRILIPLFLLLFFFFLFLTDFFAKRRRTTETKSALSPFLTSSSEAAQCKTIRWSCQKTEKRLFVSLHTVLWTKATHCTKWASCYVMLCYSVLFYFILFYFIASFTPLSVIYFIYDVLFNFSAGFIVLFIFALFFFHFCQYYCHVRKEHLQTECIFLFLCAFWISLSCELLELLLLYGKALYCPCCVELSRRPKKLINAKKCCNCNKLFYQ